MTIEINEREREELQFLCNRRLTDIRWTRENAKCPVLVTEMETLLKAKKSLDSAREA